MPPTISTADLISRVEAEGMPLTLADAIYAGFTADQWRQLRIDASMDHCAESGRCHGTKRFCLYCGKVDKTCDLPGCAIHKDSARCGTKIATTSGWRICAREPDHQNACFAIQAEWSEHRKALRNG